MECVFAISIDAGLPNVVGTMLNPGDGGLSSFGELSTTMVCSGCLYIPGTFNMQGINGWGSYTFASGIGIDASKADEIYGTSSTVTPLSLACQHILKY